MATNLPDNKIKKVQFPGDVEGDKTYEIIPERLQGNGYEAALPTLTADDTLVTTKTAQTISGAKTFSSAPLPGTNVDLGNSSHKWKDVYVSGSLKDGTNLVAVAKIENSDNKVTSMSASSTDTQYPSAKAVYSAVEDVREVAEGKTATFVCSDVTNPALNSQEASVSITSALTDINNVSIALADFNLGDTIFITEVDVPDRWVSNITKSGNTVTAIALSKLETAKASVTDVQVNGTSIVNNSVANLVTNTAYDASSNKIATMSDLPEGEISVTLNDSTTTTNASAILENIVVGDAVDGYTKYIAPMPTVSNLSSVAGSATSGSVKSVRWYNSGIEGVTAPYDGMKLLVKIPRVGVSTGGVVLSINGNVDAQYHPVAYNASSVLTSQYPVGSYKLLVYDATATQTCYLSSGTSTTVTGVWKCDSDYSKAGTVTSVRVQATAPVVSSVSTAQTSTLNTTISLNDAYGDTKNPYGVKTKNTVLAGPNGSTGHTADAAPSFRALVKADLPTLTASDVGAFANPMSAAGDLIVGGSSGTPARLAKGTSGQVLSVGSSGLAWTTPVAGMTNPMTAQGDLIVGGSSGTPGKLAKGTAGQVLTMNSGATAPEWSALPAATTSTAGVISIGDGLSVSSGEVSIDSSVVALQSDLPEGETDLNINDTTTTATADTLSNIVLGDSTNGYTRYSVPQGTVTSVGLTVPTGLSISGSPITSNGTLAITLASGYSIPSTSDQTAWSAKAAGDHTHSFSPSGTVTLNNTGSSGVTYVESISSTGASGSATTRYLHPTTTSVVTGVTSNGTATALTGVKVSSTSNAAPNAHTHNVTASGSVSLTSSASTSTGAVSYISAVSGGGATGSGTTKYMHFSAGTTPPSSASFTGSAATSGNNSGTKVVAVTGYPNFSGGSGSLEGNTTSSGGTAYVASLTTTKLSASPSTTSTASGANSGTAVKAYTSVSTAGGISASRGTSGTGTAARKTLTISHTDPSFGTTSVAPNAHTHNYDKTTGVSLSTGSSGTTIATGGTTKYLHHTHTAASLGAASTGDAAPDKHTHDVTATGSVSLTSGSAPSLTFNDTSSGGQAFLQDYTVTGTAASGTTRYLTAGFSGTSVTTGANSGTAVQAATAVASDGTATVLTGVKASGTANAITALAANTSSTSGDITYLQSYAVSGGSTTATTKHLTASFSGTTGQTSTPSGE